MRGRTGRAAPILTPMPMHQPYRNLVILRAGDRSLHPQWIAGERRTFDLFVSYYGDQPDLHRDSCDHYERRKGPKWPCIADLLRERPELIDGYDAVWFPDDDLAVDTDTLNRMFALFHGLGLGLAQPALAPGSFHSWACLLQRPEHLLRHSTFVEVMAPIFTLPALRICLPSFAESRSGWGLDWVWPHLLADRRAFPIGILDATPVLHTRPLGGELYKNNPELSPQRDDDRLRARYGTTENRYTAKHRTGGGWVVHRPGLIERLRIRLKLWNAQRLLHRRARHTATTP